jgi:hypothetical protein
MMDHLQASNTSMYKNPVGTRQQKCPWIFTPQRNNHLAIGSTNAFWLTALEGSPGFSHGFYGECEWQRWSAESCRGRRQTRVTCSARSAGKKYQKSGLWKTGLKGKPSLDKISKETQGAEAAEILYEDAEGEGAGRGI